jgi:hypothetical protein
MFDAKKSFYVIRPCSRQPRCRWPLRARWPPSRLPTSCRQRYWTFYASVTQPQDKLECWSLASIIFGIKARALNSGAENACQLQTLTLFNIAALLNFLYASDTPTK